MSHVDDGKLNALLDGELETAEAAAVEAHIAGCAECAKRLAEAKHFLTEAADLLGALELPKQATGPEAQPRRVSKTAKEVALDLDGATQQSPAVGADVPERLFHRGPRAQPERRGFDYTSIGWAATIVLAIGAGYIANEVRHARDRGAPAEGSATGQRAPATTIGAGEPAPQKTAPLSRTRESGPGAAGGHQLAAAATPHGPPAAKAPPGKGKPVVAGRSATGLGHKRLEPPARSVAGVRAAPVRPTETAAALTAAPAAAGAPTRPQPSAPEARRPQPAAEVEGAAALQSAGGAAPRGAAARLATLPEAFRHASLEQAVTSLRGTIRLIDGMHSDHVEIGPGRDVAGADSGREVVRVVYGTVGHELVLDQQRTVAPERALAEERADSQPSPVGMGFGDTLLTTAPDGQRRLRWLDRTGFWLSLTGRIPADSLRQLAERVR